MKIATDAAAADAVAELRTLREALRVTKEREAVVAKAVLDWLDENKHEVIVVEGLPILRVRETTRYDYDVASMPEIEVAQLARANVLGLQIKKLRDAVSDGRIAFSTRKYRSPKVTRSVAFDREDKR